MNPDVTLLTLLRYPDVTLTVTNLEVIRMNSRRRGETEADDDLEQVRLGLRQGYVRAPLQVG